MANFEGDFLQSRGDQRQRAHVMRVTVALNDLRSYRSDMQAQALADFLFDFGAKMRGIPNRAGNFPVGHAVRGFAKARNVSLVLCEPAGDFQAKGDGLGMHAMGAANLWRVLKFVSTKIEH